MKLLKFNLIFIPFLALWLGLVGYTARTMLLDDARQHVIQNARIIMETMLSSRTYTTKQVAPLLQQNNFKLQTAIEQFRKTIDQMPKTLDPNAGKDLRANEKKGFILGMQHGLEMQQQFLDSVKGRPEELTDTEFHPQSVPAFAATEIFGYLREKFPDYFYKEATLNPTNPRDRVTDWESDVVNQFRASPTQTEFISTRESPTGTALFLARPIKVNNVSCLECHSTPDKAPAEMIKLYGGDNGFNWQLNDIIGAQIVSVPVSVPVHIAEDSFRVIIGWLAGAFGGILIIANIAVGFVTRQRPWR
jgi:protein-histidine pros-kinase